MTELDPVASPARGSASIRSDIQGLRAIAVLAVILNHLIGWPAGGFVGVDVFFVVSGFLITDLLLRQHESRGRISLATFYARRVRRIVPAAVTVLLVTVIAGHFLFNTVRQAATVWDAGYALVFLANLHFGALGTDYFHALGSVSPVQHFWSLSVEEQFYLFWPWLVALAIVVAGATAKRLGVGILAVILIAISFWWAMTETSANPAYAYFDTLSRAWELGVGALLAAAVPLLKRMPFAPRFILGWVGLAGIVFAFFRIDASIAFPGPWAALPVVATALVIAAGVAGPQRYLFPLHNPVSVYLGSVSYSLYLWHFPVIAFMLILVPTQTPITIALIFGLIVAISLVGYYLVEQPFHRSPLFEKTEPGAWQKWRDRFGSQFMGSLVGIAVITLIIVFVSGSSLRTENPLAAPEASAAVENQLQADLSAALVTTTWPDNLSPTLDAVMTTTTLDNPARGCFEVGATPSFDQCTWGLASAPHQLYLVGDSTALAYAPAFKAIAEASEGQWKITTVGLFGCRFTDVLVTNDTPGVMDSCPTRKADVTARILTTKPDIVVVSNAFSEATGADGTPLSTAALVDSTIAQATAYDTNVVYLSPPPLGADLGQCYSPVSTPQACTVGIDEDWQVFDDEFVKKAGANRVISSLSYSCVDGRCPAFAGTVPTKFDSVHMTVAYAVRVAPAIRNALVATGLL